MTDNYCEPVVQILQASVDERQLELPILQAWNSTIKKCVTICNNKNVLCYLGDAMPVQRWIDQGCKPAITNSIVLETVPKPENLKKTADSFYGIFYCDYPVRSESGTNKKFSCFINRMDPIRQSWLYQFIRKNIFDQGYVSFNMNISKMPWYTGWDPHLAFQHQFEKFCKNFEPEHNFIKSKVPYKNFQDKMDLSTVILDSKINVVLETYFDNNNIITYSEKIFQSLQLPRPWLLFSHKNAVKYLRNMGFDVLDDIIDHSEYDHIDFSVARQAKILDILVRNLDIDLDHDRLEQAAIFNQNILKNFSETLLDDFVKCVNDVSKI